MNKIIVGNPTVSYNRISYNYSLEGEWADVFNLNEEFFVEYSCDVSKVPEGMCIVPFLCNILPIAWVYDAEIVVPCVDKAFYDSIEGFKNGYREMYPMIDFLGKLTASVIQENHYTVNGRSAAFFSGGADAFNTLIQHIDEKPTLLTLWGADVKFEDTEGWSNVTKHLEETKTKFSVDGITVKSSFRRFINEIILIEKVKCSGDAWWHGFQHGIGIIGHASPVSYVYGFSTVYISSSFTIQEKGKVTCASDPTIDNYVRFGDTQIVHDGYEFCRQDKVHNIVNYSRKMGIKAPLRVCWISTGGKNCCRCEKCWRTMLALYAENVDPRDFGFNYSDEEWKDIAKSIRVCRDPMFGKLRYEAIQSAMRKNCTINEIPKELRWFYKIEISKLGKEPTAKRIIKLPIRVLRKIARAVFKRGCRL